MIGRLAACALVALLAACGRFGATDDTTDGTDASIAPGSDGGTDARDDGSPPPPILDAGPEGAAGDGGDAGVPLCEVPATANVLSISPGSPAVFQRKFSAMAPIARSIVDVDLSVTIGAGTWQSGAYFGLLSLGYGDGDDYTSLPVTQFTVTPTIDQDVWRHAGTGTTYYQYASLSPMTLPSGTVKLHADVQWADPGFISFLINGTAKVGNARTLDSTVTRQKVLTLEIGGNATGSFPSHQITIERICVAFQ